MNPWQFNGGLGMQLRAAMLAVLFVTSAVADEPSDHAAAVARLDQMSMAMSQMSYQGTFVYVQGALVETMRITHVVDQDGIHERLVAVTGPQREVWRDSSGVRWITKERQSVVADPSFKRSYFPDVTSRDLERAADHYRITLGELEPIAGRLGRKLNIVPLDKYRYGYTMWLEEPSGLLLKWEIYEDSARPLARLMFTDISLGQEVDLAELSAPGDMAQYSTHNSDIPHNQEITRSAPVWVPAQLPPGFDLTTHRRQGKRSPVPFQHLVYSDGVAAVSIYVEQAPNSGGPPVGTSRLGTTHAFSRNEAGMQITVVGDVPAITVEEIGRAVSLNTP